MTKYTQNGGKNKGKKVYEGIILVHCGRGKNPFRKGRGEIWGFGPIDRPMDEGVVSSPPPPRPTSKPVVVYVKAKHALPSGQNHALQ
jgi:hypothetical protein